MAISSISGSLNSFATMYRQMSYQAVSENQRQQLVDTTPRAEQVQRIRADTAIQPDLAVQRMGQIDHNSPAESYVGGRTSVGVDVYV